MQAVKRNWGWLCLVILNAIGVTMNVVVTLLGEVRPFNVLLIALCSFALGFLIGSGGFDAAE